MLGSDSLFYPLTQGREAFYTTPAALKCKKSPHFSAQRCTLLHTKKKPRGSMVSKATNSCGRRCLQHPSIINQYTSDSGQSQPEQLFFMFPRIEQHLLQIYWYRLPFIPRYGGSKLLARRPQTGWRIKDGRISQHRCLLPARPGTLRPGSLGPNTRPKHQAAPGPNTRPKH